jgi:hypothetical protein
VHAQEEANFLLFQRALALQNLVYFLYGESALEFLPVQQLFLDLGKGLRNHLFEHKKQDQVLRTLAA